MASLKDIRRRITSVKNTQQITRAMKMVAASKLRRAQEAINGARPFSEKVEELTKRVVADIAAAIPGADESKRAEQLIKLHPLLHKEETLSPEELALAGPEAKKTPVGLVIVTSDRGLCGAYNSAMIKYALRRYNELSADPTIELKLYFYGKKGMEAFRRKGILGHHDVEFWQGKLTRFKTDRVAKVLTEKFLSREIQRVEVCFTQFKSALQQTPTHKVVLPLELPSVNTAAAIDGAAVVLPFVYAPEKEVLLGELLPQQLSIQFYRIFADSLASELGARMTAMENATKNSGKMISGLTLEANRVRQAAITKDLMEIIGGAEALK